jgi:hypothetical protein
MLLSWSLSLLGLAVTQIGAWAPPRLVLVRPGPRAARHGVAISMSSSLYQDQQAAMLRRAEQVRPSACGEGKCGCSCTLVSSANKHVSICVLMSGLCLLRRMQERQWLETRSCEQRPPVLSAKAQKKLAVSSRAGGGFGASSSSKKAKAPADPAAPLLASILKREGVIRVDGKHIPAHTHFPFCCKHLKHRTYIWRVSSSKSGALSTSTATALQKQVLAQRESSRKLVEDGGAGAEECFGIELERGGGLRCDLLLPLTPVAPALEELLGANGKIGALLEHVCGKDGLLYELCALITEPGSPRQTIHPDTPFQEHCPLYAVFVALQDVTDPMG